MAESVRRLSETVNCCKRNVASFSCEHAEQIRVLLVDDDVVGRENFVVELRQAGLEVLEERVYEASLQSLSRCAPDVLMLAIGQLSGERSGKEFLSRLRFDVSWKDLPVIVLSRLGNPRNLDILALGVRAVVARTEATATDVAWWIRAAIPQSRHRRPEDDRRTILTNVERMLS
jgi:CheY-like chemotaxis protein